MRTALAILMMMALAVPAAAQHSDHGASHAGHGDHVAGEFPEGWHGRVDRESQQLTDVNFMTMGDAFHIITGAHVILWHEDGSATGAYRTSASFRQTRAPEHLDGFGLIVGGRDLDGPGQDYLYFLVRHDGSYMIRHRAGTEVHTLAEWTEHDAVERAGAETAASNELAIESRPDEVRFLVNGEVVHTLARAPMLNTDGIVGLRLGHNIDVHVEDLAVTPISN